MKVIFAEAGPRLTRCAAHTSHSEGRRSPGTLRRKCTARSSPPAHGWPGRATQTHTQTNTWLKVHARFPLHVHGCPLRFQRKKTGARRDYRRWTALHVGLWNTRKHTDGLRSRAVTNTPLRCSQRRPPFSRRSEGGREGGLSPQLSAAAAEHRWRGPSSPALCIVTPEFTATPAFLVF